MWELIVKYDFLVLLGLIVLALIGLVIFSRRSGGSSVQPSTPPPVQITFSVTGPDLLKKTIPADQTFGIWSMVASDNSAVTNIALSVSGLGDLRVDGNCIIIGASAPVPQTLLITVTGIHNGSAVSASKQVSVVL